jgi:hypothetical protein
VGREQLDHGEVLGKSFGWRDAVAGAIEELPALLDACQSRSGTGGLEL